MVVRRNSARLVMVVILVEALSFSRKSFTEPQNQGLENAKDIPYFAYLITPTVYFTCGV